jgi:6-phosphogluconate dehydrogenase (decarboxylating)
VETLLAAAALHGSVIRSWLVELMERGLRENKLEELSGYVEDTREVKWVSTTANGGSAHTLTRAASYTRDRSGGVSGVRQEHAWGPAKCSSRNKQAESAVGPLRL